MGVVGDILKQEDAVIAPIVAVSLAAVIATCGLATDVSVWYAQRRDLQSVTDAAALAAAPFASEAGVANSKASSVVQANHFGPSDTVVSLQPGFYCPNVATASIARFSTVSSACGSMPAPVLQNAVRVVMQSPARTFLLRALGTPGSRQPLQMTATATATRINEAGLSAGTGVLDLNTANSNLPFVKAILNSVVGGNVNLDAVSYQGLVNTHIDALSFLNALATELNVSAGTYNQLLQTNATVGQVLTAAAGVLATQNQTAEVQAAAAGLLALKVAAGNTNIQLGQLFDLGTWGESPIGSSASTPSALHAGLDLYQLGAFALELSNGSHAVTIPQSTLGIPNLASLTIAATAIEPPQSSFAFGPEGLSVHTAQIRLQLNLAVLNLGSLLGVNVPLYVEVAPGDARIASIACNGDPSVDAQVGVQAQSGLANIYLGQLSPGVMTNFSQPVAPALQPAALVGVNVVGLAGLSVSAMGKTSAQQPNLTDLTFCQPGGASCDGVIGAPPWSDQPGADGVPARVSSGVSTEALLSSLTSNLTLSAQTCLLGLCTTPAPTKLTGIVNVIDPVLTGVDGVVTQLLAALGAQIGYMDTDVTGVRCGYPVLVY